MYSLRFVDVPRRRSHQLPSVVRTTLQVRPKISYFHDHLFLMSQMIISVSHCLWMD